MLSIIKLREMTGLSQAEFAKKYKLSLATLKNWEQGYRSCPSYTLELLEHKVVYDLSQNEDTHKYAMHKLQEQIDEYNRRIDSIRKENYSFMGEEKIPETIEEFLLLEWITQHFDKKSIKIRFVNKNQVNIVDKFGKSLSVSYNEREGITYQLIAETE